MLGVGQVYVRCDTSMCQVVALAYVRCGVILAYVMWWY